MEWRTVRTRSSPTPYQRPWPRAGATVRPRHSSVSMRRSWKQRLLRGGLEMTMSELGGTSALVTGATRGFGRAIAVALHDAGANVVAVARNAEQLGQLRSELGASLAIVAADVADPVVAGSLVEQYRPKTLVLNAG